MIELSPLQRQKITEAALSAYPNEMCGVLTPDDFIHIANCSENPDSSFRIDPAIYARWLNQTTAIVHSHTRSIDERELFDLRTPSYKDYWGQKRSGKAWLIVGTEGENVTDPVQLPRMASNDYAGRPFIWFVNDCYTIVQDYYHFELGIDLPGHPEGFDWRQSVLVGDLIEQFYRDYGFVDGDISALQNGDILILNSMRLVGNHLGIYHDGDVIHQDGLSARVPFSVFHGRVAKVLRHAG